MRTSVLFAVTCLALLINYSCNTSDKTPENMPAKDHHSFAHPEEAIVRHLDLNLQVDFKAQQLSGTATLHIDNLAKGD